MATNWTGPLLNAAKFAGPREWFEKLPIGQEPDYVVLCNDFIKESDYTAGDWTVTETGDGTQAIAADELNGALLLTCASSDNDSIEMQLVQDNWKMSAGKRLWFEAKFKVSDATESDFFIGLATTDTTVIDGTTDSVGFKKADGSTTVQSVTEDNTSETTNTAYTCAADTYVTVGFYWNGSDAVEFFVNRSKVATHTATIEQTNKLALSIALQNGEAVAKTMTIDYFFLCQER
jgi:hypothetical protein